MLATRFLLRSMHYALWMLIVLGAFAVTDVAAQDEPLPSVVAEGAELVELAAGYGFVEGPSVDAAGALFFTDLGNGSINVLSPDGNASVYRSSRADAANGLAFDAQGRLHACEGGSGRITRTETDGSVTVLAAEFAGARFNSPNDLALTRAGGMYFTDPFFGSSVAQPQPVTGVYYSGPDGQVALVAGDLDRPNGIVLSADESVLYVTNDNPVGVGEIWAFDVAADGALANKWLFAAAARIMDGMALDVLGNLYAASFNQGNSSAGRGVWVFAPNGNSMGLIATPEQPSNCTIADGGLYITASKRVFAIDLHMANVDATVLQQRTWAQIKITGVK
jgi:gluconolactonase